jgi:signal transduction histidine kinase
MLELEATAKTVNYQGRSCIQSFYKDITEKKRLSEQLNHSQKMEAIAVLASGVAHDFNNILTAIFGNLELMTSSDELTPFIRKRAVAVEGAARMARNIVAKLLNFARADAAERLPCNLNDVLVDTLALLKNTLVMRGVTIELDTHQVPLLLADLIII